MQYATMERRFDANMGPLCIEQSKVWFLRCHVIWREKDYKLHAKRNANEGMVVVAVEWSGVVEAE